MYVRKIHGNKKSTEAFIIDAIKIHQKRYDYSLVNYINNLTLVDIICPTHGVFKQTPKKHLAKKGCYLCGIDSMRMTKEEFICKAITKHLDKSYDYSLVDYKNVHTLVDIICPVHGVFKQTPNLHLKTNGCKECFPTKRSTKEFISLAKKIHPSNLDYSMVEYSNNYTKVNIICSKHGVFTQTPKNHINKMYGCPTCSIKSRGEIKIKDILSKYNIDYIEQKTFDNCVYKSKLKFDFYIPISNICVEYDGIQHFEPIEYFGGIDEFNELKIKDNLKSIYCSEHNIKLIRIPYWDFDNIEKILEGVYI